MLYKQIPPAAYYLLSLLPVATAFMALKTIVTCANQTWEANVIPASLKFPPISLFGIIDPPKTIYFYGLGIITPALFLVSILPISSYMMDQVETEQKDEAWKASWTSAVAFVGLSIHGLVPLHPSILDVIQGKEVHNGEGTAQSTVHQLAAAVFFMLSMYHGFTVVWMLWTSNDLPTGYKRSGIVGKLSFVVKAIAWVAQILPSFSGLLFHPATLSILGIKGTLDESEKGGLAQWWTVGCLIFFYLTYSLDLLCMGHHLGQNNDAPSTKSKQN
jgi:hypothetical protein